MRLDKYVSYALGITRSEARKIIKQKNIKVNNLVSLKNDMYVDEYNDLVIYNNQKIEYKQFVYIMLNKPLGYLSATEDKNLPTIIDLVNEYKHFNLFMAGRLDLDSEGFVLLTNDGKFAHRITSPNYNCLKKYYVEVEGEFIEDDIKAFEEGLFIYDGNKNLYKTKSATLEIITSNKAYITISEGKYHQIKKMCLKLGKQVIYLKRIQIDKILLDPTLKVGDYRLLTEEEVDILKKQ